jgi:hypothetical protein
VRPNLFLKHALARTGWPRSGGGRYILHLPKGSAIGRIVLLEKEGVKEIERAWYSAVKAIITIYSGSLKAII